MASETIKKSQRPGMRRAKIIKMKSENEVADAKRIFDHKWPFGSLAVLRPNYCDGRYNLGGGYLIWGGQFPDFFACTVYLGRGSNFG